MRAAAHLSFFARDVYYRVRAASLRGTAHECPVCGAASSRFLPAGVDSRPTARCPRCNSLERHRLLWLHLERETDLLTGRKSLLHVAPEFCLRRAFWKRDGIVYTSVDRHYALADFRMDITRLTFSDSTFDSFLCMHVLEHVEDDRSAIRQLFRVLKKGGWGIFGSPIDTGRERTFEDAAIRAPDARRSAFGQHDHVRVYGRDFAGRLREEGFTVQPVDYYSSLPEAERKRFALAPGEDLFVCIKQE